jgi:hypothetical protein
MRLVVLGMLLAGCATFSEAGPEAPASEAATIRYETSPCFGTCPVYVLTVAPDGSGTFEGQRFTAVTGTRAFRASPAEVRAFRAALAPYRPAGERLMEPGSPDCGNAPTDMPSIDVRWSGAGGDAHLRHYQGCGGEGAQAMREGLRAAPMRLPVRDLIVPDKPFPPGR